MDEDRSEYAETIQVGKRRSSLGALSKSKPVTKLKSMFEAKGPAPKAKDSGLLGKLKPISASHDTSSFAAAVAASLGAQALPKPSIPLPTEQPPATPIEPLFSVLSAPTDHDALPNPSPPRSFEDIRTSLPVFSDSMLDGSEADARSVKSPGSAGFLKRMGSSIKKALTPKSSAGKHKNGGCSPGYAGSEASNLSPRPSGQLLTTPSSQPSSTSLDLNCRSDQLQSAPPRSSLALMGYEVRSAHDEQDWGRALEGSVEVALRPVVSSGRPPRSPSVTLSPSDTLPAGPRLEASPHSICRDVGPRMLSTPSPDQSQYLQPVAPAGAPLAPEDSFVSAEASATAIAGAAPDVAAEAEDSFAASLTASPTAPEGSEASRGSPPMREVNMGAAIFSPPALSLAPNHGADACEMGPAAQIGELIFPSLPSSELPKFVDNAPSASSTSPEELAAAIEVSGISLSAAIDVDMAAHDSDAAAVEALVVDGGQLSSIGFTAADDSAADASMDVDGSAQQEPALHQPPLPLASRRSFGGGASLNLDLTEAVAVTCGGEPSSPDATTPTGEGSNAADRCIIGLTPVRPDTAAMCAMHVDTPVLSTVAENSPEQPSPPRVTEMRAMDLEADFSQAGEMEVETAPTGAAPPDEQPPPCALEPQRSVGTAPAAAQGSPSAQLPVREVASCIVETAPQASADMDWDGSAAEGPCLENASAEALPVLNASPLLTEPAALAASPCAAFTVPVNAGAPAALAALLVAAEPRTLSSADVLASAAEDLASRLPEQSAPDATKLLEAVERKPAPPSPVDEMAATTSRALSAAMAVSSEASEVISSAAVCDAPNGSSFCQDSTEQAPSGVCAVVDDTAGSSAEVLVASVGVVQSEDKLQCAAHKTSSPALPSAEPIDEPKVPADEVIVPLDAVSVPLEAPLVHIAPPATATDLHVIASALVDGPCCPQPLALGGDMDMGDAHGASDGMLSVKSEVPIAVNGHSGVDQLPVPDAASVADAQVAVDSPDSQPPPVNAPAAIAATASPAGCSPVEEVLQYVAAAEQVEAEPGQLTDASQAMPDEPIPATGCTVEGLGMYGIEEPTETQLPVAIAGLSAESYDSAGSLPDAGGNPQVAPQDCSFVAVAQMPPLAESAADAGCTGPSISDEPVAQLPFEQASAVTELPSAFLAAATEAAAATDDQPYTAETTSGRLPSIEADTDLMDVDCPATSQLPSESPISAYECAAEALATFTAASTAVEVNAALTSQEQQVIQQLHQSPGAVAVVSAASVASAEGLADLARLQQGPIDQSMEHDFVACGSTNSDMSFLDAAFAARTLADPACEDPLADSGPGPAAAESPAKASALDATCTGAALAMFVSQQDDPMMMSPMPLRLSTLQPALHMVPEAAVPGASPDVSTASAPPSATPSAGTPNMPAVISPETAKLGVRAFQLEDVEVEPEASAEVQVITAELSVQEQLPADDDQTPAQTLDTLPPPMQSASPIVDGMLVPKAATPVPMAALADMEDALEASITVDFQLRAAADAAAAGMNATAADAPALAADAPTAGKTVSALNVIATVPSVSKAVSVGLDVPMADSLETIEALWGNDNLLGEADDDDAGAVPLPQIASSPVSASKPVAQSESPVLPHTGPHSTGRKVAPGVVLQVQRESLDLFSLRNSCAARVSDSLMVESLDSFESMGLCAKSRAVGFVPMAPLKEADEDATAIGRTSGSEGGSAPTSAGQPSPDVTFAVDTRGSPDGLRTPGLGEAVATTTTGAGTPSANKPAACSSSARVGTQTPVAATASQARAPLSALKSAIPGGVARPASTPSTALKAMAAASGAGPSAVKAGVPKRPLPAVTPSAKAAPTPGQPAIPTCAATVGSRLPGLVATQGAGVARTAAGTPTCKPLVTSQAAAATPGAAPGRPGVTPRTGGMFGSGSGQAAAAGISRPGPFAQQPAPAGTLGSGSNLFDTPVLLRAAAVPLADTPFSGCDFDMDTVDISAEASKAIAALGAGDANLPASGTAGTATQHTTPMLAPVRGGGVAGTPTLSVLETHVQMLTNKLAEAEANIHQLQDENAMLRDQVSTLQFESSMTNDLDMEREARQFLEQELAVVRHRSDGLESDLRAAHAEVKRRDQATADLQAAQQTKEAEWARCEAEMELRMQQMTAEVEAARSVAQQADARVAAAEARAAAATAKCEEETSRSRELQVTLGLQAHQLVQLQRSRDEEEAKFQKAMQQLIGAQTSHKKAVVEYEQKLQLANAQAAQYSELREKFRQVKQHALDYEQRAQQAEAKVKESTTALGNVQAEKNELLRMCNELLTQLEATKSRR